MVKGILGESDVDQQTDQRGGHQPSLSISLFINPYFVGILAQNVFNYNLKISPSHDPGNDRLHAPSHSCPNRSPSSFDPTLRRKFFCLPSLLSVHCLGKRVIPMIPFEASIVAHDLLKLKTT
jgi:hypothetical protein